jgi:glucose 1-dehydrogenase
MSTQPLATLPCAPLSLGKILAGQKALVTGANSGIGASIARAMAEAGAAVAINYVANPEHTEELIEDIRDAGGTAIGAPGDVSNEQQVHTLFKHVIDAFGNLDILVTNAGVRRAAPLYEMTLADWNDVIAVNLTGQFLCAREAIRTFIQRKARRYGSCAVGNIISISSVHDHIPCARHANYAASKGGALLLMRTLAQELAPYKIRVNTVSPGIIRTASNHGAWKSPEAETKRLELIPYGRLGTVEDIANAAVWLASDFSDYITGATIYIDGGMTLSPGIHKGD